MSIEITQTSAGAHVQVKDTTTGVVNFFPCRQSTAIYANNTVPNGKIGIRYRDEIFFINVADVTVPAGPWTALTLCQYLDDNFFVEPDVSSVSTFGVITGNGSPSQPVKLADGVNRGDIIVWDSSTWQVQPNPSWNLDIRRNVKTFSFAGGFSMAPPNQNFLVGTPFQRNSTNVSMLNPGADGRDPVIRILNASGVWIKLLTTNASGCYFVVSNTTAKKYYYRQKIQMSAISGGSFRAGFLNAPGLTVLGGFGFECIPGGIRAFANSGASYSYGATYTVSTGVWYDCEIEYKYIAGQMEVSLFVDGVLVSNATRTVASFTNNCMVGCINSGGSSSLIAYTDLIEYSIYG